MANSKSIIFAFASIGKSTQPFIFSVGGKIVTASGENFMPISLMTHIPYDLIIRSIENMMKRYGKFNNPKAGSKMAPMQTYNINDILPQFIGKLLQLIHCQLFQISG